MPTPEEIGHHFRVTRKKLGWTQEDFAEQSGVAEGTVKNAERGEAIKPSTHNLLVETLNRALARKAQPSIEIPMVALEQNKPTAKARLPSAASGDPLNNPNHVALCEALRLTAPKCAEKALRIGEIRSLAELKILWHIDADAYGETSISFEHFRSLWETYRAGLRVLFCENEIIGATGIWPVTESWLSAMKAGEQKEASIDAEIIALAARASSPFWYVTGIVLHKNWIGSRAIKTLLDRGLSSWLETAQIRFPCTIAAIAYSPAGLLLLKRFNFYPIREAQDMPDGYPLYGIDIESRKQLIGLLKKRRLAIKTSAHGIA